MSGTSIARMDTIPFDFSEEARRIPIKPCGHEDCQGYGEFRSFRMHNGVPRLILLCRAHDSAATKEDSKLQGELITDIGTIMELFKILLNGVAAEAPQIEAAPQEPEVPTTEEAQEVPQKAAESTTPILEFTDSPEKSEPQKTEEKAPPTTGVYILAERPTENHYFCVEDAKTGEPCNEWFDNSELTWHAKSVHGIERYQNHTQPEEKHKCVRGDHKVAGCVMSFKSPGGLSTHLTRTKVKFPPTTPQIPHPTPEPTPQHRPADADHATT